MVRRSVGRVCGWSIGSGLIIDDVVKFESGDDGEVGLEVVSEVIYRDGIIIGKYIKVGVNMKIDNSVGWGANRGVGGEVHIS